MKRSLKTIRVSKPLMTLLTMASLTLAWAGTGGLSSDEINVLHATAHLPGQAQHHFRLKQEGSFASLSVTHIRTTPNTASGSKPATVVLADKVDIGNISQMHWSRQNTLMLTASLPRQQSRSLIYEIELSPDLEKILTVQVYPRTL